MQPQRPGPFRIEPKMGPASYRTFEVAQPITTHYRQATCAEVRCLAYESGWQSGIDESTDLGQRQAHYIRKQSGRSFTESRSEVGITVFVFEPGQRCFASDTHRVPLERPALYVVREGDWRGNPREIEPRVHARAADWVDEFANHQDRLATEIDRG